MKRIDRRRFLFFFFFLRTRSKRFTKRCSLAPSLFFFLFFFFLGEVSEIGVENSPFFFLSLLSGTSSAESSPNPLPFPFPWRQDNQGPAALPFLSPFPFLSRYSDELQERLPLPPPPLFSPLQKGRRTGIRLPRRLAPPPLLPPLTFPSKGDGVSGLCFFPFLSPSFMWIW